MKTIIFILITAITAVAMGAVNARSYGEAVFRGIVMDIKEVNEPFVRNCYVTLQITHLRQNKKHPIQRIARGDVVTNVLDTPLCDLRRGSVARGLLIDNGYTFENRPSLMYESF